MENRMEKERPDPRSEVTVSLSEEDVRQMQAALLADVGACTHIGTREYQQDAFYVSRPTLLGDALLAYGILCDGMGGMLHGEQAAQETAALMAERLSQITPETDIPAYLLEAARAANEHVLEMLSGGEPGSAGTTLVAAVIAGGVLYWLSIGDSRLYILRGEEIVQVTRDHNLALNLQAEVARGALTEAEAEAHPHREALISFVGIPVLEVWDVNRQPFALRAGDIVLLCSDGLTKALSDHDILALMRAEETDAHRAAEALVRAAVEGGPGARDNTTAVLLQYKGGE